MMTGIRDRAGHQSSTDFRDVLARHHRMTVATNWFMDKPQFKVDVEDRTGVVREHGQ